MAITTKAAGKLLARSRSVQDQRRDYRDYFANFDSFERVAVESREFYRLALKRQSANEHDRHNYAYPEKIVAVYRALLIAAVRYESEFFMRRAQEIDAAAWLIWGDDWLDAKLDREREKRDGQS